VQLYCSHGGGQAVELFFSHGGVHTVELIFSHGGVQTVEQWTCSLAAPHVVHVVLSDFIL